MDENRVNNTDPVVQVRLRVMFGNFHGAGKMVRLAAGSVCPPVGNAKDGASGGAIMNYRDYYTRLQGWISKVTELPHTDQLSLVGIALTLCVSIMLAVAGF